MPIRKCCSPLFDQCTGTIATFLGSTCVVLCELLHLRHHRTPFIACNDFGTYCLRTTSLRFYENGIIAKTLIYLEKNYSIEATCFVAHDNYQQENFCWYLADLW